VSRLKLYNTLKLRLCGVSIAYIYIINNAGIVCGVKRVSLWGFEQWPGEPTGGAKAGLCQLLTDQHLRKKQDQKANA